MEAFRKLAVFIVLGLLISSKPLSSAEPDYSLLEDVQDLTFAASGRPCLPLTSLKLNVSPRQLASAQSSLVWSLKNRKKVKKLTWVIERPYPFCQEGLLRIQARASSFSQNPNFVEPMIDVWRLVHQPDLKVFP